MTIKSEAVGVNSTHNILVNDDVMLTLYDA